MKIALVSPELIVPADAGNRARIAAVLRALQAAGHAVHLIYTGGTRVFDHAAHVATVGEGRFHSVPLGWPHRVSRRIGAARRALLLRLGRESGYRYRLDEWLDRDAVAYLRALDARERFDVAFVEYVFASGSFAAFRPEVLRILDTHDRFGDRHRLFQAAGRAPEWYSLHPHAERRGLRRADVVLAIQAAEGALFAAAAGAAPGPDVRVVSHLLDLDARVTIAPTPPPAACMVGSDNPMNVDGLAYLVEAVLPRVRARRPDFRLHVAGTVGRSLAGAAGAADAAGVVTLGRVDRLADMFARAPLLINPVRFGTGIAIKVLDAMAAGVPVIATESGLRGLDAGRPVGAVAVPDDDPDAMARAIVAMIGDPARHHAAADAAHAAAVAWNARQGAALAAALATPVPRRDRAARAAARGKGR